MICLSIGGGKSLEEIFSLLEREDVEMAEIRLDLLDLGKDEREELFSASGKPLIATCRPGGRLTPGRAAALLEQAALSGADYIDLEIDASPSISRRIKEACADNGVFLIRSYHNMDRTPDTEELLETVSRARRYGADIVKIATMATCSEDCDRVMSLYDHVGEGTLVAFAMGGPGRSTRAASLGRGAPFGFAALSPEETTAPGQWTLDEMNATLYGGRSRHIRKGIRMNASKSFAQRAIIAAALSGGRSVLHGYTPCRDNEAAIAAARTLGAEASLQNGTSLVILPRGRSRALTSMDVGESGLLARLLIPLVALGSGRPVTLTGEGTLLRRPLQDASDIMASFGVVLKNIGDAPTRSVRVPLSVEGQLMAGRADISGKGGSQLISGLLMALPLCPRGSTIFVHDPRSIPYMYITVDVLRRFGIEIESEMEGGDDFVESGDWNCCTAINFHIKGNQKYHPAEMDLEADWSSAAVFLVAGAIFGEVSIKGLDTSSLQADLSILDILASAGASVSEDEDGTVNALKSPLYAFDVDLNNAPDLFPVVSVLAAFSAGESHIRGLGRLYNKESNRSEAVMGMLRSLGVECSRDGDELTVVGHSLSQRLMTGRLLKGGSFSSHSDHRMVMALRLAALGADGPVQIDDEDCVAKSFPGFNELF